MHNKFFSNKKSSGIFFNDYHNLIHHTITILYHFVLQGSLMYNEYIVYNVEQIRMRYVVSVKFNFGSRR